MENAGVHQGIVNWLTDYLSNSPHVRMHDCASQVVKCSIGGPQRTVLGPVFV